MNEPSLRTNDEQFTAEIKAKWLAALRGGKYSQAHGRLRDDGDNTMCCLGVLCDVIDHGKWHRIDHEWAWGEKRAGHRHTKYLPANLREHFGFNEEIRDRFGSSIEAALANRNDGLDDIGEPWTFAQIADWIEAHIPALENVNGR